MTRTPISTTVILATISGAAQVPVIGAASPASFFRNTPVTLISPQRSRRHYPRGERKGANRRSAMVLTVPQPPRCSDVVNPPCHLSVLPMSKLPPFLDLPDAPPEPPRTKSRGLAVLLATLFGPLGLFYASPVGGLLMTLVSLTVGLFTVGVGLLFAWPVCILWAYAAVSDEAPPP